MRDLRAADSRHDHATPSSAAEVSEAAGAGVRRSAVGRSAVGRAVGAPRVPVGPGPADRVSADPGPAGEVDGWLRELELDVVERVERDGVTSWDLLLDGRRRRGIRVTVILDPGLVLVCWAQYAPALSDTFRKSYRQFLRWNDEFPFVKFALSSDESPVLSAEIPADGLDRDRLGLTLARILAICDLLLDESLHWLSPASRAAATGPAAADPDAPSQGADLIGRYQEELGELLETSVSEGEGT
jgi:putative sensory transduction regulator